MTDEEKGYISEIVKSVRETLIETIDKQRHSEVLFKQEEARQAVHRHYANDDDVVGGFRPRESYNEQTLRTLKEQFDLATQWREHWQKTYDFLVNRLIERLT
jgi:hypothetical protein